MRGDRAARDTRHNKDHDHLKSSLKKGNKSKKNKVVFDESANEFFEADYIIVVRDECGYSDEGESEECSGCGACERYQEGEPGALSPPEGYKDMGLFNRDGTLREQAWWEAGDVALVGERSGTVFTPQHLQLLRRLQRERMLRAAVCDDCDARAQPHHHHHHHHHHQPAPAPTVDLEYNYEEEEPGEPDRGFRPVARRTGKHIAAGEERPKINSSQQTTPIDECPHLYLEETEPETPPTAPATSEESDATEVEGRLSADSSPLRTRRAGILKGGRLWKSLDGDKELHENEEQRSTTASDEDGSVTPRSVRFIERPSEPAEETKQKPETQTTTNDNISNAQQRIDPPLALTQQQQVKANSAVQQLFNNTRPHSAVEPQLTSETLRAWDAGVRPKAADDSSLRRVAERNALRCSLLRSEARKKQQPKQETTSLADRIRLLTCDVEDEHIDRTSPAGASADKYSTGSEKSDKYNSLDKNEKAFGSASSSSSSSTISVPVPAAAGSARQNPPDLGDAHQEPQKSRPEPRRQFLSSALTACVGSTAHHENVYYPPSADRGPAPATTVLQEHYDAPAPDVVAGTPGASDGDDSLAAFAHASAPRTERLRQKYGQESQPASSDDEHDDYGFHRRPAVRGISVKQQLGASYDILQQMQSELQPATVTSQPPAHACQRANPNYSWNYYTETSANSRPQSRASANSSWSSKSADYAAARAACPTLGQHTEACYAHAQNMAAYVHYQHRQDGYTVYANVGCSDSSQELFSSQTSSEQTSPVRAGSRYRRPESPPPIRSHHQLLYLPYNHYHYQHQHDYAQQQWAANNDYNRQLHSYYQHQHQSRSGTSTPQPTAQPQRAQYTHPFQLQTLCPAPAKYRNVPAQQPGGGKQMICYSEKDAASVDSSDYFFFLVVPPLYQPAPGSPQRAPRGAPEGAPSNAPPPTATSPVMPPTNPVYYAMNV